MIFFNKKQCQSFVNFLKNNYPIILILVLGGILRGWGINYDLSVVSSVGDELTIISRSLKMLAQLTIFPQSSQGAYFPLIYYLYLIAIIPYSLVLLIFNGFSLSALKDSVIFDLSSWLLVGRIVSLILGTLSIYLIYLIAKRIFKTKTAVYIAALLFALDPLNVVLSHFGRVWEPQVFFILLALFFSLFIWDKPGSQISKKQLAATALFILLSFGVNAIGIISYLLWLLVVFVYRSNSKLKDFISFIFSKQSLIIHCLLITGGLLIIFLAKDSLSTYSTVWSLFLSHNYNSLPIVASAGGQPLSWWFKIGHSLNMLWQYQTAAVTLFIPAAIFLFFKERKNFYFLLCSSLVFFLCLNPPLISSSRPRYQSLLTPFIILSAAWLIAELFSYLKGKRAVLASVFIILAILPSLFVNIKNDFLLSRSSTNSDLYFWLKDNLRPGDNVLLINFYLSQELLPNLDLIRSIKELSPQYYSFRLQYINDKLSGKWLGGYGIYSDVFLCQWPQDKISSIKFKYVVIADTYEKKTLASEATLCGYSALDLTDKKVVFDQETAPYFNYSLTDGYFINGNIFIEVYRSLWRIKKLGPQIKIYQLY